MPNENKTSLENSRAQMRKGLLEYCILLVISRKKVYASDIIASLRTADLLVVEGTMYPLLSRLKNDGLLDYHWQESKSGPPRKYYELTSHGKAMLKQLDGTWEMLQSSINALRLARA
ncbi:PadR family transcriptional regulator [Candidatus Falkowbacteria bacterium HGW-Falkowbacteria-2]|uniref:PadR family transcriptional regulator n=1 Tax=Candidatus Falkowbacteria bacterium HGW-Falkowbacteria-2 TaxID=2013769 RepID=A0A2N2E1L3_9BACT|nr:MAG: PadR family transcriptional regulator [Candidatus Falkowbacteria bacterium HGW-Falkowbacteria-2]